MLDFGWRWLAHMAMRTGSARFRTAHYRPRAPFALRAALDSLAFIDGCVPGFSWISMGESPFGNGLSGDLFRSLELDAEVARGALARGSLAFKMAAFPADVPLWNREALERRSFVAKLYGFVLSLRNTAASNRFCLVLLPPACVGFGVADRDYVCDRTR